MLRPAVPFAAVLLAACAGGPAGTAIVYHCEDGTRLTARFPAPDQMTLEQGGSLARMQRVPTASGAKYADHQRTFWSRGESALYETSRGMTRCTGVTR